MRGFARGARGEPQARRGKGRATSNSSALEGEGPIHPAASANPRLRNRASVVGSRPRKAR
jgi:hypothetical protein